MEKIPKLIQRDIVLLAIALFFVFSFSTFQSAYAQESEEVIVSGKKVDIRDMDSSLLISKRPSSLAQVNSDLTKIEERKRERLNKLLKEIDSIQLSTLEKSSGASKTVQEHDTAAATDKRVTTYVLKKGEHLAALARRYYDDHNLWAAIYLVNQDKLQNWNKVYPGQELKIPSKEYAEQLVKLLN